MMVNDTVQGKVSGDQRILGVVIRQQALANKSALRVVVVGSRSENKGVWSKSN